MMTVCQHLCILIGSMLLVTGHISCKQHLLSMTFQFIIYLFIYLFQYIYTG